MSSKFKKLSIKIVTSPKAKSLISLKSPTSTKAKSLPTNSFKNTGVENMIQELLEVKKEKYNTLHLRKQEEGVLFKKFFQSIVRPDPEKLLKIKLKYKEKKHGLLQISREQTLAIEKKLKAYLTENTALADKLRIKQCNKMIEQLGNKPVEHEISQQISEEISTISSKIHSTSKLNEEISKLLSIEDLQPYYADICIALAKKISDVFIKRDKIKIETMKFVDAREKLSNQLRISGKTH